MTVGDAVSVDDEAANLLDFAATLHDLSAGRFDITSCILRKALRRSWNGRVYCTGADNNCEIALEINHLSLI